MKHLKHILLLALLWIINLSNLSAQNMECHGVTTALVNNQPGELIAMGPDDGIVDDGMKILPIFSLCSCWN